MAYTAAADMAGRAICRGETRQGGKPATASQLLQAAEGRADDAEIYASFNAAAEHVEKQLRRNKRKLRDHH